MERSWWGRFFVLLFFTVMSVVYVIPTFTGMDLEKSSYPLKQKINLGLDLQGGLYMVLGVEFKKIFHEVLVRNSDSLKEELAEKKLGAKGFKVLDKGFEADDHRFEFEYTPGKREEIYRLIKENYTNLRITQDETGKFQLGLATAYRSQVREQTIEQSIEVIRNRIDEFGVTEPVITAQGSDRIVVELPGVSDVERAKSLIGQTAKLTFQMVAEEGPTPAELTQILQDAEAKGIQYNLEDGPFSAYVEKVNEFAKDKLAKGTVIAFQREVGVTGEVVNRVPYILFDKVALDGEEIRDASVTFNQEDRSPEVAFSLNPRGANTFDKLTAENTRKFMAIVLDGIVVSAPRINGRIPNGRGVIQLGRGNQQELIREAKDLAIVLRAGALPAKLDFLEQRVVGPSLGQDSIEKGSFASIAGAILVLLAMVALYKGSGAIAAASLILNVLFVLAILVGLEATLTLPGIAGIALTVGIAVDSNVIIYERIKEELRAGKGPHAAVTAGFQKAFRSILDANITTAAAGVILMAYGSGPIRGFAVTLLIGIVTTLFTAVFVCRLMFDVYLARIETKRATGFSI
jgi:preprotein translocase subunit SecD